MRVPSTNGETIHIKANGRYSTAVHVQATNGETPHTSGEKSPSTAPGGLYLESTKCSNVLGAPIGVHVDGTTFTLNGDSVTYRFHVDAKTGDLRADHFGGRVTGSIPPDSMLLVDGVQPDLLDRVRRELPDQGRGDFRIPAIRIRQSEGHTVSDLKYRSHTRVKGKPALPGLPSTFGSENDVTTIIVHLFDEESAVAADVTYSIFPRYNAIARSISITNQGRGNITVEVLASMSVDFPVQELDMITLSGDHMREAYQERRRVQRGLQGFQNSTGFSSHLHNPFLAIALPSTTESSGCAWGFSLVYSGSSAVNVERGSQGLTRVILGLNPAQLSWPLAPGESLSSPECVSVYSPDGLGGMSRALHRLYRNHLMKSRFVRENRPVLLNSWEGLYFDIDHSKIYEMAKESAALGVKLFVMDDGWFGNEYPRISDSAGLGDWVPNRKRFPNGLGPLVNDITQLGVKGSETLRFGIWVEPEMVNPKSNLYCAHPDWVLSAGSYPRTEQRNQLILNLALPEVQNYIILFMTNLLTSAKISYVKWDHNRSMTEIPSPSAAHAHMLGLYKVLENLTAKFPDVLFEGCAAGGGRFDPGILKFFPQTWTSDNTDAVDRIYIQLGMSLAYPASSMGCHISAVPNHQTHRTTPFSFRAHVAMMGGSFGLELDPKKLLPEEKAALPSLIALAERINPIVVNGDMWRLSSPYESNWPAVQFISEDASQVVLFYFQLQPRVNTILPRVKLQGLAPQSMYRIEGEGCCYSGMALMNHGLSYSFKADYGSRVVILTKEPSS